MPASLQALRVVEIAGSTAGGFAAKLFADHGARVVRLGDPSHATLHLDAEKHCVALEDEALRRALASADVLLESRDLAPAKRLEAPLPGHLVHVRISPTGERGPRAHWRSDPFTDDALGGHLYLNGWPDRAPAPRAGSHAHVAAGLHAFIGALAALRAREHDGRPHEVEVSHLEALASMHQHTTAMWIYGRHVLQREGNRQPGYWHPAGIYACRDGHVALDLAIAEHRDRFLSAADMPELLVDARFRDDLALGQHKDAFDAVITPWLRTRDRDEIVETLQRAGAAAGPVRSFAELFADPHLKAREAWRLHDGVRVPAAALRVSKAEGRVPHAVSSAAPAGTPKPGAPLAGVRVLDLTRVWAGPFAGRLLADLGADVIAVEAPNARGGRSITPEQAARTHLFPDDEAGTRPFDRHASVNELQRGKRCVTLDLRRSDARTVFERLVARSDVVLTNFTRRALSRLELDTEALLAIQPHLIHANVSGYGTWGPDADRVALGPVIEAGIGQAHAQRDAERGPLRSGVAIADPLTGLHLVAGVLVALQEREADPKRQGRAVEISMQEVMLQACGDQIEQAQRSGPAASGAPKRSLHPCRGEDRWIAVRLESATERQAFLATLGARPELPDAEIDDLTSTHEATELAERLQATGVCACPVSDARDLCTDPQLAGADFWAVIPHSVAGTHALPGTAIQMDGVRLRGTRAAPCLGEHNREVLRELAELEDAAIDTLVSAGVLVDTPP